MRHGVRIGDIGAAIEALARAIVRAVGVSAAVTHQRRRDDRADIDRSLGVPWRLVMTKLRKVTDEHEARACIAAAEAAGQSSAEWARERGIDGRSLHAWRLNLSRCSASARAKAQLVELVPVAPKRVASRYVVHVGEMSVELGDDFEDKTLRRLIAVLRSC